MESTHQPEQETYRAIVLGRGGNELLLARAGDGFLLPSVEIPRWQRVAENLTAAMRNEWGHEVICLFSPDAAVPARAPSERSYQVMESCDPSAKSSTRTEWVRVACLSGEVFADPADYIAVQRSIADCTGLSRGLTQGPFAKLGWFRELQKWIEEVIEPLGFHLTGTFAQLNASPSFSLVRFETSGPAVWFKAVGKPNLREFPITLALARSFPQHTPSILATRPELNGWLSPEVKGSKLGETQNAQHWNTAASALAKLQIESIGNSGALIQCGARDLRARTLLQHVRPFLDVMGQLMQNQTKVPPPVLSRNELILLGEQIEEALFLSTDLGIPDALGHLDLNPGNVIVSGGHCVFLDWAEAYVGHPFFSFQYLLETFRRMKGVNVTVESRLTTAYAQRWRPLISPESIVESLVLARVLAVFAYAAGCDAWSDEARLRDSMTAGYLRSLTRRMNREAQQVRVRRVPCPN
jgi:hypothetical protein